MTLSLLLARLVWLTMKALVGLLVATVGFWIVNRFYESKYLN